jgi:hypothetical protein
MGESTMKETRDEVTISIPEEEVDKELEDLVVNKLGLTKQETTDGIVKYSGLAEEVLEELESKFGKSKISKISVDKKG